MAMKKISGVVLVIMTLTFLFSSCSGTIYKVGDSDGWTRKDDTYYSWAEGKEFHVGDSLVFEYDHNVNDVTQVSGALEHEFCDSSSPKAVYNTGHDVVTLTEPRTRIYITTTSAQIMVNAHQDRDSMFLSSMIRHVRPSKILPFGKMYKVGDSKGWNVYDNEYYYKWNEEKEFHVDFEYNKDLNDVLEISGDLEFKSCDPTSPISVHKTVHDLVRLTKPGVHYFISSKTGHCEAGLKLRLMVRPLVSRIFPRRR